MSLSNLRIAACACAALLPAQAALADDMQFADYWNGKSPMTRVNGQTMFEALTHWGDASADPILLADDLAPDVRWSAARKVELTEMGMHLQDGLYFTECWSARCSLDNPDEEWVVGNEGMRFHIYTAQKNFKKNLVDYCYYGVGTNGFLTGTGFGKWGCNPGDAGSVGLPQGSPSQIANRLYAIIADAPGN